MVICYNKLKDEVIATKELFSVDQLIEHMKQKGIKFVEMTERIDSTKQINCEISNFIKDMPNISKQSRINNLNYKFTYNFITLLYVYDNLMGEISRQKRYQQIKEFLDGRVIRNQDYFKSNTKIVGVYKFHKKVVDNLLNTAYTK